MKPWAAMLAALAAGCAAPPPSIPWNGPEAALRVLHDNAAAVRTLQSSARVVLTRPDGDTVHLDAALVAAFPDRLRLRAWKLGQTVFDLTYRPDGLWLATDPGRTEPEGLTVTTAAFAKAWSVFNPEFFAPTLASIRADSGGPTFTVEHRSGDSAAGVVLCDVDRATLRPIRYTALDESGRARSTLTLARYRDFSGTTWPSELRAASQRGSVVVLIDTAHFNEDLPPAAFEPPASAVRQP